jgi:hypothetical protein
MGVAASAKLFAAGAAWRLAGVPAAGRALVATAVAGGETERTLAGMLLVQAGDRSVALLSPAILVGETSSVLIDVLASIGTDRARDALVSVAQGPPAAVTPDIRQAAVEALQTLDAIRARDNRPH